MKKMLNLGVTGFIGSAISELDWEPKVALLDALYSIFPAYPNDMDLARILMY